jgi:16S rRNA (guanine527-N7)-methyltransferase
LPERAQVLDLGSGGGLPGIPLAILCEGWSAVLLDSIQKKCAAVEDILLRLGLSERIRVVCGRAEEKDRRKRLELVLPGVPQTIHNMQNGRVGEEPIYLHPVLLHMIVE